jgi:GcrA cell cycle regulator
MAKKTQKTKTIANLEKNECRWPIGDPRHADFHFCGARQAAGRPYCELHWGVAFVPSRPRHQQGTPVLPSRRAA